MLTNFLTSFVSSIPSKRWGQKTTLLLGQCLMSVTLFGLVIFNAYNESVGVLIMLVLLIVFFQSSIGAILFIHAEETCVNVMIGFSSCNMWIWNIFTGMMGPFVSDKFGSGTLFSILTVVTTLGSFYIYFFVKDTTFVLEETT